MGIVHNEISLNTLVYEMWARAVQDCTTGVTWLHLDSVLCCKYINHHRSCGGRWGRLRQKPIVWFWMRTACSWDHEDCWVGSDQGAIYPIACKLLPPHQIIGFYCLWCSCLGWACHLQLLEEASWRGTPVPVGFSHPDPSPGRPPLGSLPRSLHTFRVLTEVRAVRDAQLDVPLWIPVVFDSPLPSCFEFHIPLHLFSLISFLFSSLFTGRVLGVYFFF